jgi:hypothetical protein
VTALQIFTLPPQRSVGIPYPPGDMNNAVAAITALGMMQSALNMGNAGGADSSGNLDSTAAINAALATGNGLCLLPPGTFLLNGSSGLTAAIAGGKLKGMGYGLTTILVGSSFTGAAAFTATAAKVKVEGIAFVGANSGNSALGGSQAWDAVDITGAADCAVRDCFFQYVNGYPVGSVATSGQANLDTMLDGIIARNCAGGLRLEGNSGSSNNGEHFLVNIQLQQIGTTTGASTGLDAIRIKDIHDVIGEGFNVGVISGATGSALHIMGACTAIYLDVLDLGGGAPCVLIEASGGNSPTEVRLTTGTMQESTADAGLKVTGASGGIHLTSIYFHGNYTDGCAFTNTGTSSSLTGCRWNTNNQSNGTQYDINCTGTGKWTVNGGTLGTTVGSGAGQVTHPVNDTNPSVAFVGTSFAGTGTTTSNVFAAGPLSYLDCNIGGTWGYSSAITALATPLARGSGGTGVATTPAAPAQANPGNPGSTASATLVMMGLGSSCKITPGSSGKVLVTFTGGVATATAIVTGAIGVRYGTGTAPSHGDAVTGTRWSGVGDKQIKSTGVAITEDSFAFVDMISLTPGTAYWFDIAISTTNAADAAEVLNVSFTATELS